MALKEVLWSRNFIIACVANFLTACSFNLLMPTIPLYLSQELGIEHSDVGVILSSYALALLVVRPFSGYFVDSHPRKLVYLVGLGCFVAMFVGYFFAVTVGIFVVLRFVHGLFWGLTSVSANTLAIDIIPTSRRAEGVGFFGVNMNLAMATAPFLAMSIYESKGFMYIIAAAIVMGILGVAAATLIQVKPRPITSNREALPMSLDRFVLVKALPILFNQLFITFGWGTLAAYAILYGQEINIGNPAYFFLFLAGGIVMSRITSGKLVDRGYIHSVVIMAISLICIGFYGFSQFHQVTSYYLSALIIGLGYGTLLPALQTIYINMAPSTQRGTASSTYLTGFDIGVGGGMLIGANIADRFNFETMYEVTAGLCLIGLFLYIVMSRGVFEKHRLR